MIRRTYRPIEPNDRRATLTDKPRASSVGAAGKGLVALVLCLAPVLGFSAVNLSEGEAKRIGQKIWQNECNGTISGLTSWNAGEDFASLGIGHFIWYPEGRRGPFEESF